jgi:hypothetical protein
MKFIVSTDIDLPVAKVAELFMNKDDLRFWYQGFISYEHIRGVPGEPGCKSLITVRHGNKTLVLTETIIFKNLPAEIDALYEHENMTNTISNLFISLGDHKTRYEAHVRYTKFNGLWPNMMSVLMPWMFKRQTQKWIDHFRDFAQTKK